MGTRGEDGSRRVGAEWGDVRRLARRRRSLLLAKSTMAGAVYDAKTSKNDKNDTLRSIECDHNLVHSVGNSGRIVACRPSSACSFFREREVLVLGRGVAGDCPFWRLLGTGTDPEPEPDLINNIQCDKLSKLFTFSQSLIAIETPTDKLFEKGGDTSPSSYVETPRGAHLRSN